MIFKGALLTAAAAMLVGCAPGFSDTGNANLTLTVEGGETIAVLHDPLRSQVVLTPPAAGKVRLSFTNNDPFVAVDVDVDSNLVSQDDTVTLPVSGDLSDNDVFVVVEMSEDTYSSQDPDASGRLAFPTLYVEGDAADVQVELDATLVGGAGTLTIDGFIEGSVGTGGDAL
jgi:hypothetical protein